MSSEPIYNCPVCKVPLCHTEDKDNNIHVVWCGYNNCPSTLANKGAEGSSIKEAVEALYFMLKDEISTIGTPSKD